MSKLRPTLLVPESSWHHGPEAKLAADVGERIHDASEAAGLSQRELAHRMGTSQAAIDRLESGG